MKKISLIIIAALSWGGAVAQSVGVGTSTPDPSAALHVNGIGQGLLIPETDTSGVTGPAEGLLVYQPTDGNFYYYSGASWERIVTSLNLQGDNLGSHIAEDHLQMSGYWISNDAAKEGVFITTAGNVGLGNSTTLPTSFNNQLMVAGNAAIGQAFTGFTVPNNSLSVQENILLGTTSIAVPGFTMMVPGSTAPVGMSQGVFAGGAAFEFTTSDNTGKQASRIAIRGNTDAADITFQTGSAGAEVEMFHFEGTNGYVGIGLNGATPTAMLQVADYVRYSDQNLYATGPSYQAGMVTGSVSSTGGKIGNSLSQGVSASRISKGFYVVNFPPGMFSKDPVITVTAHVDGANENRFAVIVAKSPSKFELHIRNANGELNDAPFDFIAVGQR